MGKLFLRGSIAPQPQPQHRSTAAQHSTAATTTAQQHQATEPNQQTAAATAKRIQPPSATHLPDWAVVIFYYQFFSDR